MIEEEFINLLLSNVSEGDDDAMGQLYEFTHKKVFNYLYRLTNDLQMAEDLLIATYTEVWRGAKKFQNRSKVITWILGIARNLTMNEFRKNKIVWEDMDENMSCQPEQHHNSAAAETTRLLTEALNCLPVIHREVLDLVFLQELRYEDISLIMNVPVNTVKTRVFHAKEKLSDALALMGVEKDDLI